MSPELELSCPGLHVGFYALSMEVSRKYGSGLLVMVWEHGLLPRNFPRNRLSRDDGWLASKPMGLSGDTIGSQYRFPILTPTRVQRLPEFASPGRSWLLGYLSLSQRCTLRGQVRE